MAGARDSCWWVCAVLVALAAASLCFGQVNAGAADLKPNFYSGTCPTLEDICMETMQDWLDDDVGNAAGMIRLWFHDCIVSGCDGSVLLDHIPGKPRTEKDAGANGSLRGFDIIDDAKSRILDACPDALVSCTDITLLLTRNAVFLTGGPFWEVTLGRRDGTKSLASQTSALPSPFDTLSGITAKFTIWNLTETDMVVLSGAHTLGFSHCSSFESRLYSRNGSAIADPTMNKSLDKNLRKRCPQVNFNRVRRGAGSLLDLSSPEQFDNRYYSDLQQRFGVLASDQLLFESNRTRKLVNQLAANQRLFFNNFVTSMIKLSQLGVLTGAQGEVRLDCSVVNGPRTPPPAPPPAPAALPAPPPAVIPAPPPAVVLAPPPAVKSLPPPAVVLAPPPAVNSLPPPPPPPLPPPAATSLAPPPDTPAAAAPLAPPPDPPAADAAPPAPAFAAAAAPVSPPPDAPVLPA